MAQKPFVKEVQMKIPPGQLLDKVVLGMSNLCVPEVKANDFLEMVLRTLRAQCYIT
jgi:hypothetical protein